MMLRFTCKHWINLLPRLIGALAHLICAKPGDNGPLISRSLSTLFAVLWFAQQIRAPSI